MDFQRTGHGGGFAFAQVGVGEAAAVTVIKRLEKANCLKIDPTGGVNCRL